MERTTSLAEAKQIMGKNFIGPDELSQIEDKMGIIIPSGISEIPISSQELYEKREKYILILGASQMKTGEALTLKSMRSHFGIDPDSFEPCFYNQDWYLNESFMEIPLESNWFLIKKTIDEETRGTNPEEISAHYSFPSAILCAYSFFAYWFLTLQCLWKHDFVWCSNKDSNGDRIYVARYFDPNGVSKNGFSIHRHLKIRRNYGCV